jgi:DNA-binding response OmpR family regulator
MVEDGPRALYFPCPARSEPRPLLVHDGETAIGELQEKNYELIILDVMLPGIDGFEVLRRLRAAKMDSRVMILTARAEVGDRVTGFALGADDYLAKPFAMRELVARVAALGRRFPQKAPVKFQVADLVLNVIDGGLSRANRRIELSARERTLLRVLMREPGRVFSRTELCERVWKREHEYETRRVFHQSFAQENCLAVAYPHGETSGLHDRGAGMRNWPLRWKIVLYSACPAIVVRAPMKN